VDLMANLMHQAMLTSEYEEVKGKKNKGGKGIKSQKGQVL